MQVLVIALTISLILSIIIFISNAIVCKNQLIENVVFVAVTFSGFQVVQMHFRS